MRYGIEHCCLNHQLYQEAYKKINQASKHNQTAKFCEELASSVYTSIREFADTVTAEAQARV